MVDATPVFYKVPVTEDLYSTVHTKTQKPIPSGEPRWPFRLSTSFWTQGKVFIPE